MVGSGAPAAAASQTMSDVEPLMLSYDASPPDDRWGALVGFIAGAHAIELGQATSEVRPCAQHRPSGRSADRSARTCERGTRSGDGGSRRCWCASSGRRHGK